VKQPLAFPQSYAKLLPHCRILHTGKENKIKSQASPGLTEAEISDAQALA
jgi:hypothetical protein